MAAATDCWRLSAFGLDVVADFPLPGALPGARPEAGDRSLDVRLVDVSTLEPLAGEPRRLRFLAQFDGCAYAMLEGAAADVLIAYGYRGFFHLSSDARVLRCARRTDDDPAWLRALMDTVLWTAGLLRGAELLHASAVLTDVGVLAFSAASGGGKTSLAGEHLVRGGTLFADDVVALDDADDGVIAHPGPPVLNLPASFAPRLPDVAQLADFGDERWVALAGEQPPPQPLAAIVIVDRRPGAETTCAQVRQPLFAVLSHIFAFPHLPRDRRRFELFSRLVSVTPVLRLTADTGVSSATLADVVGDAVTRLRAQPVKEAV